MEDGRVPGRVTGGSPGQAGRLIPSNAGMLEVWLLGAVGGIGRRQTRGCGCGFLGLRRDGWCG